VNPPYRRLEHTSDVKVEIYGADLAGLFTNAAACLSDLMLDRSAVRETTAVPVSLEVTALPELFLDWLRELLLRQRHRLWGGIRRGTPGLSVEVKTPTYHEYRIEKTEDGYRATVILDV